MFVDLSRYSDDLHSHGRQGLNKKYGLDFNLDFEDLLKQPDPSSLSPEQQFLESSPYSRARRLVPRKKSGVTTLLIDTERFHVEMVLDHFTSDDLQISVVEDYLIVSGSHEERADEYGLVSRRFSRKFKLPKDVNFKTLKWDFSVTGTFSFEASRTQ